MKNRTEAEEFLVLAIDAARKAGEVILEVFNSNEYDVELKEDSSPVTRADLAASQIIDEMLATTGIPFLSEEKEFPEYEDRVQWRRFWMVDPLDGTKEFVNRRTDFTVNIALIEDQVPVLGVIYVPLSGEIYLGSKDTGSYKGMWQEYTSFTQLVAQFDELPLQSLPGTFTMVGSRSHMNRETMNYFEEIKAEKGEEQVEIIIRGSSLKMCLVAEGKAHQYPRLSHIMEWDTAAGHAICEGAGCRVTQWDGTPLRYNKADFYQPWFIIHAANPDYGV